MASRCLIILIQLIAGIVFFNLRANASDNRSLVQPIGITCENLGDYGTVQPGYALINAINQNGLSTPYVSGETKISELADIVHTSSYAGATDGYTAGFTNNSMGITADFIITLPEKQKIDGVVLWNPASDYKIKAAKFFYDSDDDNDGLFNINAIKPVIPVSTAYNDYFFFDKGDPSLPYPAQIKDFTMPDKAKFIYMQVQQNVNSFIAVGEIAFTTSPSDYTVWRSQLGLPISETVADAEGDGIPDLVNWAVGDGTLLSHPTPQGAPLKNSLLWNGTVDPISPDRVPDPDSPNFPMVTNGTSNGLFNPIPAPTWSVVETVENAGPVVNNGRSLQNGILQVHYSQVREFKSTGINYTKTSKKTKVTVIRVRDDWFDSFTWPSTKLELQGPDWNSWTLNLPDAGTNVEIHLESRASSGAWVDFLTLPIGSTNSQPGSPLTGALQVGHSQVRARVVSSDPNLNNVVAFEVRGPVLNNLAMNFGSLSPAFATATTSYTSSVANAVSSITVTPTVTDSTATVKVNNMSVTSGSTSSSIPLSVGNNSISVLVTAQDGVMAKIYTVIVNRAPSSVATLGNLALNNGTLSPAFAAATISYTASVVNAVSSITVTPIVTDSTATVKVNNTPVASGSTSSAIPLSVGSNAITVLVTAQDATTIETYVVVIIRESAYDSWVREIPEQQRGLHADPAGDGVSNLMKYALAIAPLSPAVMPEISQIDGFLTLKYRRNNQAPDLIFTVQAGDSLNDGQWVDLATSASDIMDPNPFSEITVQDTVAMAGNPHRFMRLKITKQ